MSLDARGARGATIQQLLATERPLAFAGVINAYCALLAERAGLKGLYLSGAGVANASFGLPDLGITTLNDVAEDASRITAASELPLLVDIDTGFGGGFSIARTVRMMERAGVAAVHIEDQELQKRCGHRPQKAVVPVDEMVDRLKYALDARRTDLFLIARTDAAAVEGLEAAIERAARYAEAGADAIFAEAVGDLAEYRRFAEAAGIPVLANLTEFGQTPLWNREQLAEAQVAMVIYPLSAFRVMSRAAQQLYATLAEAGSQASLVDKMQTREELYEVLDYYRWEQQIDRRRADGK